MERLTCKRHNSDGYLVSCLRACRGGDCGDCVEFGKIINRLAAYEDRGWLTPEQCENAKSIIESVFTDDTSKAEHTRDLLKADKEGRVVVLPCKVGDTYYTIGYFCSEDGYYDEKQLHYSWNCEYCSLDNCDKEYRVVEHIFQSERSIYEKKGWLGECAWLTREEAEAARGRIANGDK